MNTLTMCHVVATVFLSTLWAAALGNSTETAISSVVKTPVNQASLISDHFSNTTLRKCKCGADEVLDGVSCRREPTTVDVMETTTYQVLAMNTSAFSRVTVAMPQCPDGVPLVLLDSSETIVIMPFGELLVHYNLLDDYCVEHVLRDDQPFLEAHVCLPPPPLPLCCPPGHILAPNSSCVAHNFDNFAPPVEFNSEFLQWKSMVGDVKNISCEGISEVRRVKLDDVEGRILYSFSQPILSWKPSVEFETELFESEFCVGAELDSESGDLNYVARTCYLDPLVHHHHICTSNTCIRKCCPKNQVLFQTFCVDVSSEEEVWKPVFHPSRNQPTDVSLNENFTIVDGFPLCTHFSQLNLRVDDKLEFFLMTNGSLRVPIHKTIYPATDYCLDNFLYDNGIQADAVLCDREKEITCLWRHILLDVLRGVTCVFLVITMAVYLGVPELRDRTNGRCLISMVSAMLTSYICIICNIQIRDPTDTQCVIVAFVGHVSTLATFFWLNVMCYDLWSTLRSSRQQYHSMKRFLLYGAYAWGCPLVVGVITIIIDNQETSNLIRPKFVENSCWFFGDAEYWLYLQGIICILVLVNLFFFVHVAISLSQKMRQRRKVFETSTSHSSNSTKTKEQAWLYVKLLIVMGVVWIADVVSSVQHRNTCTYWVFTDIINGLQGVLIFLVAVCNKDNLKKIRGAWRPRIKSVQRTMSSLRGKSTTRNKDNRTTDQSMLASDASRKTSVTSLPRKISVVSNVIFPNSNKVKGATQLSDTPESSRRSPAPRKISNVSNIEVIPMTTMDE